MLQGHAGAAFTLGSMIPQDMLQGLSRLGVAVNSEARMSAVKDVLQLTSCSNLYIRHAMKQAQ